MARLGVREELVRQDVDRFAVRLAGKDPQDSQRTWEIRFAMDRDPTSKRENADVTFSVTGESPLQGRLSPSLFALKPFAGATKALGAAVHLHLGATGLSEPSYLGSKDAKVDFDGYGLASTIAHLMTYGIRRIRTWIPRRQPDSSPENEKGGWLPIREDGPAAGCLADHPDSERFRGVLDPASF